MAFNVLSAVNDVALKIGASQELSEILQFTLGKVLEVVQTEAGSVYLLDDQRAELTVAASRGLSEEAERDFDHLRIGEGLSGRVAQDGTPIVLRNLKDDPRLTRMAARREGFRGFASIPVRASSKMYGTLNVHTRADRAFTDEEIWLLTSMGVHLGVAVANARFVHDLETSERRFRGIVERADDLAFLVNGAGHVVYANPSFHRLVGGEAGHVTSEPLLVNFIHPEDRSRAGVACAAIARGKASQTVELRMGHAGDGRFRWFSYRMVPLLDDEQVIVGIQVIAREMATPDSASCHAVPIAGRRPARAAAVPASIRLPGSGSDPEFVANSPAMQDVLRTIKQVANSDSTVLIVGETGTGKELVARLLHGASDRQADAFVPLNCGAVAESMLEAELFGHTRGAFTGAIAEKEGLLERADGGLLFLDEIGEMPPSMQVRLLRFLERGEVRRIGSTVHRTVDVRVVAATNRDLAADVASGRFRLDLYYRINVVTIALPPLRARQADILPLAGYFSRRVAARLHRPFHGFSPEAEALLSRYGWPGNVRELQNVIERALVLGTGDVVTASDLPTVVGGLKSPPPREPARLDDERMRLRRTLQECHWNRNRAAAVLGMSRTTLWRKMRELGLHLDQT